VSFKTASNAEEAPGAMSFTCSMIGLNVAAPRLRYATYLVANRILLVLRRNARAEIRMLDPRCAFLERVRSGTMAEGRCST
jgi:hypothetical protein